MTWYLRNEDSAGAPDAGVFQYGGGGWVPVVGDWSGSGQVGIGAFDPKTATWYLRSSLSSGWSDAGVFAYGGGGWQPVVASPAPPTPPDNTATTTLWSGDFSGDWKSRWQTERSQSFGSDNLQVIDDPQFGTALRVFYPADSASPSTDAPVGGAQFVAYLGIEPQDTLTLSYSVRFASNFDWVKGGKLPGLFGGTEISGSDHPDGTNGFSTRFMWRTNGNGEIYALLPTSGGLGTSLGSGSWQFTAGQWYQLQQEVHLNTPGQSDGWIRIRVNGQTVYTAAGLTFRTVGSLQIQGIFFSSFFGGNDSSWATPVDTYADFAGFSVFV
jgi:hypothetical protein